MAIQNQNLVESVALDAIDDATKLCWAVRQLRVEKHAKEQPDSRRELAGTGISPTFKLLT